MQPGIAGAVGPRLPIAQSERGVLAREMVRVAMVGLDSEQPEIGMRSLEHGDRGVVVRATQLVELGAVGLSPCPRASLRGRQVREVLRPNLVPRPPGLNRYH